jgi:hypothetical protein
MSRINKLTVPTENSIAVKKGEVKQLRKARITWSAIQDCFACRENGNVSVVDRVRIDRQHLFSTYIHLY